MIGLAHLGSCSLCVLNLATRVSFKSGSRGRADTTLQYGILPGPHFPFLRAVNVRYFSWKCPIQGYSAILNTLQHALNSLLYRAQVDRLGLSQGLYQRNFVQVLSPFLLFSFPICTSPILLIISEVHLRVNVKLLFYVVLILAVISIVLCGKLQYWNILVLFCK